MDKAPGAFRTISEVAEDLDLPQHVLRFWETRFPNIKPLKRAGGRRYYRPDDVLLLRGIKHLLYGQGYTIRGVQRILKEQGLRHVMTAWQLAEDEAQPPPARSTPSVESSRPARPPASTLEDDLRIEPRFSAEEDDEDDLSFEMAEDEPEFGDDPDTAPEPRSPSRRDEPALTGSRIPEFAAESPAAREPAPEPRATERRQAPLAPVVRAPLQLSRPETAPVARPAPAISPAARRRLEAVLRDLLECRRALDV
ncbi:MerR family transcriptional regulator [Terrihabitans rhizophilus]|uniref:MerR family transcriptional regulator n=1 Tax=Terrihabitans rhizophilus TaxID=3092662 RepID=A0ABU4RQJ3_9HYPH|nr:MerR family transcriptional regulator [Terrihabitans sp. PJ23]MDX6807097.1 MerR family transcriptional regulator [Terrihabitans sp. PJ23]